MFKLSFILKNFKVSYDFHKINEAMNYVDEFIEHVKRRMEYKSISNSKWHFFDGNTVKSFAIYKYDGSVVQYCFLIEQTDKKLI